MVEKTGIGSGTPLPPSPIPSTEFSAADNKTAGSVAPLSEYFWQVAKAGAEYLGQAAQLGATASSEKVKPEEATAHFDRANEEFKRVYKEGGTEEQVRTQLDAMQAAVPAMMEAAKDPEVAAYLKTLQDVSPDEATKSYDSFGTIDSAALKKGIGKAPTDPQKAQAAFEILTRMKALAAAKSDYFSKYYSGSQEGLQRLAFYKEKKAEAMLKEMGSQLRQGTPSLEAQRLLVAIDENTRDFSSLAKDLDPWKEAADKIEDPKAKVGELAAILQRWGRDYGNISELSGTQIQEKLQGIKEDVVATVREHPELIATADGNAIPAGAERVQNFLDKIFPAGVTIVNQNLLPKLSPEGMAVFAQLQTEAEDAVMSAVKKTAAGDNAGAKEDYLLALGDYAELKDEAATQAIDGKLRELLAKESSNLEILQTFGRMYGEVEGSGVSLESQLKDEIGSPDLLKSFVDPALKLTEDCGAKPYAGTTAELLKVSKDLVQVLKVREAAGIPNDDQGLWVVLDRMKYTMRKVAADEGVSQQDKLDLREQAVSIDVALMPEVAHSLQAKGSLAGGSLLGKLGHSEWSGTADLSIDAKYRGQEMVQDLQEWQTAIFRSHLGPEEELDKWAAMSGVLSLYRPLTKAGDPPVIAADALDALIKPISQSVEALAPKLIAQQFPELADKPDLLAEMGSDLAKLSSDAMAKGEPHFASVLRDPKALSAFVGMTLKAKELEGKAQAIESDLAKLQETAPGYAEEKAKALQLHMKAAELYAQRGGPVERVRETLKPAMDFYEGVTGDPDLIPADRAEGYLDIAELYQGLGLKSDAGALYDKVLALDRDQKATGKDDARLSAAATMAQGEKALLKEPPDYDAAKTFFHSLPDVTEAQQRYDAIVAFQRSQRLPKVMAALQAVAEEYASKLEQRDGKTEADQFRAEFEGRAALFQEKLQTGNYRTVEELFADFGYVHYDPLQGYDDLKWFLGKNDSMDWKEFNRKSLALLQAATNPEAADKSFAELGLDMGEYVGSAGDLDFWDLNASDVDYFAASGRILDMMSEDQYVGAQAKSYRDDIPNRVMKNVIGKEFGNLTVVGAENLNEAAKSAALWLIPLGVGKLAGTGARLLGAGERLALTANMIATPLSQMLVESAWTGNWDAFSAKGLATTGVTTFASFFGYKYISRLSQGMEEIAMRSEVAGMRIAGQAAVKPAFRVLLKMSEFSAGGLYEAGSAFAEEAMGLKEVDPRQQGASFWWRAFERFSVGGATNLQMHLGEHVVGGALDIATNGKYSALEQKIALQDRLPEMQEAAKTLGWDLDFKTAQAWIEQGRPPSADKLGEQQLAALMAMDPRQVTALAKDPKLLVEAKRVAQKLYPALDPNSWEAQMQTFGVLDYFGHGKGNGIAKQFEEFQKAGESLGFKTPELLGKFYQLSQEGLPLKQVKDYAIELASDPKLLAKLDVLVDAYCLKPGATIDATLRSRLQGEVALSLFEESLKTGKSPKKLLAAHSEEAKPKEEAVSRTPEFAPGILQKSYAGLPVDEWVEGFAKWLGYETKAARKEKGRKAIDAWLEGGSSGEKSSTPITEATKFTVGKMGKEASIPVDAFLDQAGMTHPGLREKFTKRLAELHLSPEQVAQWNAKAPEVGKGLEEISKTLLGPDAMDSPAGQMLAAELLSRALSAGGQGKYPAAGLSYLNDVGRWAKTYQPLLDRAAKGVLGDPAKMEEASTRALRATLFLKAVLGADNSTELGVRLKEWTNPGLWSRVGEILRETEANGVSTPAGRQRVAKAFLESLGKAESAEALLRSLVPDGTQPIVAVKGVVPLEQVEGISSTRFGQIKIKDGSSKLVPKSGYAVEVLNSETGQWVRMGKNQELPSGTWIRQPGSPYGQKLFTLSADGKVFLQDYAVVTGRIRETAKLMREVQSQVPEGFQDPKVVGRVLREIEISPSFEAAGESKSIPAILGTLEPAVRKVPAEMQGEIRSGLLAKALSGKLTLEQARKVAEQVQGEAKTERNLPLVSEEAVTERDMFDAFGLEIVPENVLGDPSDKTPLVETKPEEADAQIDDFIGELYAQAGSAGDDADTEVDKVVPLPQPRAKAATGKVPEIRAAARLEKSEEHGEFAPAKASGASPAALGLGAAVAGTAEIKETISQLRDLLYSVLEARGEYLEKIFGAGEVPLHLEIAAKGQEKRKREFFEEHFPQLAGLAKFLPDILSKWKAWEAESDPAKRNSKGISLEAGLKTIRGLVADFRELHRLKDALLQLNSDLLGMEMRGGSRAGDLRIVRVETPLRNDSADFDFRFLEDSLRARDDQPAKFPTPEMKMTLAKGESVEGAKKVLEEKAEKLGLTLEGSGPNGITFRTPGGSRFHLAIEVETEESSKPLLPTTEKSVEIPEPRAAARVGKKDGAYVGEGKVEYPARLQPVKLGAQTEKIPLGATSYLEKVGGKWLLKNPEQEGWFLGADQKGLVTGDLEVRDGDVLVPLDGLPVLIQDPVLRAKPAVRIGQEVEPLESPQGSLGKISVPMDLSIHGIKMRTYAKDPKNLESLTYEVSYHARPGEKLMVRRGEEWLEVRSSTGGTYDPKQPARLELQPGDVLEIHTVQVGKKNPVQAFPFDAYGALLKDPKVVAKKPNLAGRVSEAEDPPAKLTEDPAVVEAPPAAAVAPTEKTDFLTGLAFGAGKLALALQPYLTFFPMLVEAVQAHGPLGGGMQVAAGGLWGRFKGMIGLGKEEAAPNLEPPALTVAGRVAFKSVTVGFRSEETTTEAITIGGERDRDAGGKIPGEVTIPGLPQGIRVENNADAGKFVISPAGGKSIECTVKRKQDGYQEKKATLSGEMDFDAGDQIVLPHPEGPVTIAVGKNGKELESSRPFAMVGADVSLPQGAPLPAPEALAAARVGAAPATVLIKNFFGEADPIAGKIETKVAEHKIVVDPSGKEIGEANLIAGGEIGTSYMAYQDGSYVSAKTSDGGRPDHQEDSTYLGRFTLPGGTEVKIIAGSDGAGGAGGGDVASSAFLQGVHARAAKAIAEGEVPKAEELFRAGRDAVIEQRKQGGPRAKKATGTGSIVVIVGDTAMIASAGDAMVAYSRRFANGEYQTLGYTHIDNAASNIISNSISMNAPNLYVVKGLKPGDRFTLASDGGWENVVGVQYKEKGSTQMRGSGPTPDQGTFRALNGFLAATLGTEGAGEVFHDLAKHNIQKPGQPIRVGDYNIPLPTKADADNIFGISYEQGEVKTTTEIEVGKGYRELEPVPLSVAPPTKKLKPLKEEDAGLDELPTMPRISPINSAAEIDWSKVDAKGQHFYFRYAGGQFFPTSLETTPGAVVVSVKKVVKQGQEVYEVASRGVPKGVTFFLNFEGKRVPLSAFFKTQLTPRRIPNPS